MQRVQRSRKKGAKLPANTRCVNRPTKWGNPYKIEKRGKSYIIEDIRTDKTHGKLYENKNDAAALAVELFTVYIKKELQKGNLNLNELRTFDNLACVCSLQAPCHADVLIELLAKTE